MLDRRRQVGKSVGRAARDSEERRAGTCAPLIRQGASGQAQQTRSHVLIHPAVTADEGAGFLCRCAECCLASSDPVGGALNGVSHFDLLINKGC